MWWGVSLGCSSNHDLLAQKPDAAMSADVQIIYGNAGGSATMPRDSGPSSLDSGDPEPPGPWTLTWVNGVVDEEATRVCFVPVIDGHETPPATAPLPTGNGLPFGGKLVLEAIPSIDLAANDLHPYLVPKSAGFDPAATCETLLGAAAGDAASIGPLPLPIIPAGTLSDRRSYLAVATGCTAPVAIIDGGPASDKPPTSGDTVCGPDPGSAMAGLVLVRLSRLDIAPKLGFQVVHASAATPDAILTFAQPLSGSTLFSTGRISFGQIAPPHEPKVISVLDLRSNAGMATVTIGPSSGTFTTVQASLADILMESGLDEKSLDVSSSFTFVLIGARPGKTPSAPWHAFDAVMIENAP
jgi:hypothetical protein